MAQYGTLHEERHLEFITYHCIFYCYSLNSVTFGVVDGFLEEEGGIEYIDGDHWPDISASPAKGATIAKILYIFEEILVQLTSLEMCEPNVVGVVNHTRKYKLDFMDAQIDVLCKDIKERIATLSSFLTGE
jgi:hypothetical protein